ncbi:uncharacterized protein LOC103308230 [Acyrthosiphon pisum]|uniref:Reverse transcriptase domain-containing protein n=1 Tax=Acyrthosiphon pisum TaxID=7029 RepID=A0A8R2AZH4_ACYPI|nr:uncharacterized protein LOC103308230 [Acyrthosiphon pisum]|eukprot:XP_008179514.1 PREDICTED: uncharacterized protein LOC103308230 [Acyrthosiphon pisum]
MVNKRLIWHLETSNFFTEEQCGFRQNHSTIDTLLKLHTDITNAKCSKQHLCLIALDIEKAYDMAWRNRILKIIQRANINDKMFLFLKNFLNDRTIQIKALNEISNIYTTENVNNTLSSIIDPLNKIRDNIGNPRTHSSVHPPPSPPPHVSPITTPPSAASTTSRQSTQRSLPDFYKKHSTALSSSSSSSPSSLTVQYDLNELYEQWPTVELDKVYAPKKLRTGEYVLGNKEIKFIDNEMHIEDDAGFYPITPGLIELLFAKSPATEKYTHEDLSAYKRILILTSAHMTADGTRIRSSIGAKYMKVISKLFEAKDKKSGSGINIRLQKHNIVYWNDPNELVDRLRLLYSSLAAGNTGVRNEIISICEELVEAGILKKIPNV